MGKKKKNVEKNSESVTTEDNGKIKEDFELEKKEWKILKTMYESKVNRLEEEVKNLRSKLVDMNVVVQRRSIENQDLLDVKANEKMDSDKTIQNLTEEGIKLRDEIVRIQIENEKKITNLMEEAQKREGELNSQLKEVKDKLDKVEFFKKHMESLEQEVAESNRQLKEVKEQMLQERQKLNAESKQKLEEQETRLLDHFKQKIEKLQQAEQSLDGKTAEVQKRNEMLLTEMQKNGLESSKLAEINRRLMNENQRMKIECDLAKEEKEQILKRNVNLQSNIRLLSDRLKRLELRTDLFNMTKGQLKVTSSLNSLTVQDKHAGSENVDVLLTSRSQPEQRQEIQDEIADFIVQVMRDVKERNGPWRSLSNDSTSMTSKINDKNIPISLYKLNVNEREMVFRYLLSKLHERKYKNNVTDIKCIESDIKLPSIFKESKTK